MPDPDLETRRRAGLQKKKHFQPFVPRFGLKIREGGVPGPSPGSGTDNLQSDILSWVDSTKVASKMKREEGPPDCRLMMTPLFTDPLQSREGLATWPLSSVTVFLVHVILKATFITGIIISLRVSVTKWSQD